MIKFLILMMWNLPVNLDAGRFDPGSEIKKAYRASFTSKAAELSEFITALEVSSNLSSELLSEIGQYLHRLAGSLAMYGYREPAEMSQRAIHIVAATDESDLCAEIKQSLSEIRNLLLSL